jgi:antirestriction protein ArdC
MSDLYTTITQRIVEQLEAGTPAWVRPWSTVDDPLPTNAVSKRPYRGVNQLLLSMQQQAGDYPRNVWLTFRQALQLGGCVRKGAYSTPWRTRFHADGGQCSSVMADGIPR